LAVQTKSTLGISPPASVESTAAPLRAAKLAETQSGDYTLVGREGMAGPSTP